ncbi:MAG TPA: thioredoxin family protein [Tissierellaceae bacterium]|nr:thioredoxin family protein [Tissierellaceae bacterium]
MKIKILGTGCSKCDKVEKNLKLAMEELNICGTIEKVEELKEIVRYGVMTTPTLVIDDKVMAVGKVLSVKDIKKILSQSSI